ncbi:unnamed protein product [Phytomonas sp. EM1]|nr:unnamed protein product [Phytomonas sp. EM1]|eukprot:CCW61318.1 unnamed protein product [Phytomonas sp. isolate EM1]
MAPKAPPPPRPDPLTLDQIYECLTSRETSLSEKAYHLVALNSVAFNPTVKLFFFDEPPQTGKAGARGRCRREQILQAVATFLAQRNNAICEECQWETASLIGEFCRMEGGGGSLPPAVAAKLNDYARKNLEFLAQLPWFVPAIHAIMGGEAVAAFTAAEARYGSPGEGNSPDETHENRSGEGGKPHPGEGVSLPTTSTGLSSTHDELRRRLREGKNARSSSKNSNHDAPSLAVDQDVVIVLQDILRALPKVVAPSPSEGSPSSQSLTFAWTKRNLDQAHDLMFLDASPVSMSSLIPLVSRLSSQRCSNCCRYAGEVKPDGLTGENKNGKNSQTEEPQTKVVFSRCSSCKAVYYCSVECQKAHWAAVHGIPCKSYREQCEAVLAQYNLLNSGKRAKKNKGMSGQDEKAMAAFMEVPLEPSLFFETRRYLYDHRDSSFAGVNFNDYFMKYTVRGT